MIGGQAGMGCRPEKCRFDSLLSGVDCDAGREALPSG